MDCKFKVEVNRGYQRRGEFPGGIPILGRAEKKAYQFKVTELLMESPEDKSHS